MKYKTFLTTLVLYLFFVNLGILLITVTTFKDTINRAKEQSLGEHYFITSAIIKDFNAVESRGIDVESSLDSVLQPYSYLSGDKKVSLLLYKNDQLAYSNQTKIVLENSFFKVPENGNRLISFQESAGSDYVVVSGMLPKPYNFYTLFYLYDTTDAIDSWKQMKNVLFLAGFILSGLLAVGLLLLLNQIFKPLLQISQISHNIAAGAYDTRLPVIGHDELSEMAQSFNHMAEEIDIKGENGEVALMSFSRYDKALLGIVYNTEYKAALERAQKYEKEMLDKMNEKEKSAPATGKSGEIIKLQ